MYQACLCNGYFLPNKSSSFCSMKFLMELYEGKVSAPKTSQVTYFNVLFPPTCGELVVIITEMVDRNQGYESEEEK